MEDGRNHEEQHRVRRERHGAANAEKRSGYWYGLNNSGILNFKHEDNLLTVKPSEMGGSLLKP